MQHPRLSPIKPFCAIFFEDDEDYEDDEDDDDYDDEEDDEEMK